MIPVRAAWHAACWTDPNPLEATLNRPLPYFAIVLCATALAASAHGQDAATGDVTGRVIDPSSAPVAGARVVATRIATGTTRVAATDATGRHVIASLPPGEYRIAIEAAGFAPTTIERVVVEVGRRVSVDAVLSLQGRAESVEVEERGVSVPTGNSVVGGVVGAGVVENLPLNGRNFLELAFLLPGNAPAPNFDPTKTNVVAISSAGQLGRGGNITIDGQDNNDDVVGGPLAEPAAGRGAGVPDRHQPLLGRAGPLGGRPRSTS